MQADNTLQRLDAGDLDGATRIDLSANLTQLPNALFALADTLEILNVSGNQLTDLPHQLSRFKKLKIVFASNNPLTHVPEVLGDLPKLSMMGFKACNINHLSANALPKNLQWLILTDNKLSRIPAGISDSKYLQKCMLAGNQLSVLPKSMQECVNLELMRISANQFEKLPEWLFTLPKLAWLALAGNPFNQQQENQATSDNQFTNIPWDQLTIQAQLGEGASGVIHRAIWQVEPNKTKEVAVKLFKGSMTSDGLPESEMAAFIAAGKHVNLTGIEGVISGHPQSTKGVVMSLIAPSFSVLAKPPNFSTCTRDVYDADQSLSSKQVINIALGTAKATAHLHQQGMIHGDLYAHNILYNVDANCILSDFGGASFLPKNTQLAQSIQTIEVRAFGCLLAELIALCTDRDTQMLASLTSLQASCLAENVQHRPLFPVIVHTLMTIEQSL